MSPRVLILSADIGDGHTTAARSIASQLRLRGATVHVDEALDALGRLQRFVLRDGSRFLFRHAPRLFGAYYRLLLRSRLARTLAARSLVRFGARSLLCMIDAERPDVIVSTYPATTVVLGALRESGRLSVPTVATITDVTGLFFWAHPGIDLHLVCWEASMDEAGGVAPASRVRHIAPLTSPAFFAAVDSAQARRRLGLPLRGRVVVISGGGWGVGDLHGAVDELSARDNTFVVCLAGRDERVQRKLETAFADRDRVLALGFTDRMSDLLAAADVLVHTTGGVSCLEARLRGCPVVLYGFAVGHVRHNAEAMERLGLVHRAHRRADLVPAVERAIATPQALDPGGPDLAADLVLDLRLLPGAHRPARRERARRRPRLVTACVGVMLAAAFAATQPGDALVDHVSLAQLRNRVVHLELP